MEGMQFCEQCENHCPVDSLKCGRGRRFFGLEPQGDGEHEHRRRHDGEAGRGNGHPRGHRHRPEGGHARTSSEGRSERE